MFSLALFLPSNVSGGKNIDLSLRDISGSESVSGVGVGVLGGEFSGVPVGVTPVLGGNVGLGIGCGCGLGIPRPACVSNSNVSLCDRTTKELEELEEEPGSVGAGSECLSVELTPTGPVCRS